MANLLNKLAHHALLRQLGYRTSTKTASTVVGKSGRAYVEGEVLRHRREDRNTFKAEYGSLPTFLPTMSL